MQSKYAPLLSNDGTSNDKRTLDEVPSMYITTEIVQYENRSGFIEQI